MYCTNCGCKINNDMKFCPKCGNKIAHYFEEDQENEAKEIVESKDDFTDTTNKNDKEEQNNNEECPNESISLVGNMTEVKLTADTPTLWDSFKNKVSEWWSKLSLFDKVEVCCISFCALWLLITIIAHSPLAIVLAALSLGLTISSLLIHKEIVDFAQPAIKYLVLMLAIIVLLISFPTIETRKNTSTTSTVKKETTSSTEKTDSTYSSDTTNNFSSTTNSSSNSDESQMSVTKKLPIVSSNELINVKYDYVVNKLSEYGFTNVEIVETADISTLEEVSSNKLVTRVAINSIDSFADLNEFDSEDIVTIEYRSLKEIIPNLDYSLIKNMQVEELVKELTDLGFAVIETSSVEDLEANGNDDYFENSVQIGGKENPSGSNAYAFNTKIKVITHRPNKKSKVHISINFISNLFFSRYDVDVRFSDEKIATLKHGEDGEIDYEIEEGEYSLVFSSVDDHLIKTEIPVYVCGDTAVEARIVCYSDTIDVNILKNSNEKELSEDEIRMSKSKSDYISEKYTDVHKELEELGFQNISETAVYDIWFDESAEGNVKKISIAGEENFTSGSIFKKDSPILITYRLLESKNPENEENKSSTSEPEEEKKDKSVSYSTNTKDTVKNGDSGIYSYRNRGGLYYMYLIIDFDEGYVYSFADGNADDNCDKVKIESGDLNSVVIFTYHEFDNTWSNGLHFKWKRQPDHLILEDNDHFEYDYYSTDLEEALSIRETKRIIEY